jgi:molecular chaperone DnaJ
MSDEKKRQMYDQFGMSADDQVNMGGQGGDNPFGGMGDMGGMGDFFNQGQGGAQGANFEDIFKDFDDFFGMGGGMGQKKTHRSVKGQDIYLNLEIGFLEAVNGTTKEVNFSKR